MPLPHTDPQTAQGRLDALVTQVAWEFMSATVATLPATYERTLQMMVEFFDVNTSFLRSHDHDRQVSVLVSEWPPRHEIPDPDPLGEVPFEADPVFSASRTMVEPLVLRPTDAGDAYQERIEEGSGVPQVALAVVPLRRDGVTTGVLGFVKFGDRAWDVAETNALRTVASLIVQLQARVEAQDELHHHAYYDELTDLPNRRYLLEQLDRRAADEARTTVLFVDLDLFKNINDSLGHGAGDQLIAEIGARVQAASGPDTFVARLAGDEFVLVSDMRASAGLILAEQLLDVVAAPVTIAGHQFSRTASIGVASSSKGCFTGDQILDDADVALRAAKRAGGNHAVVLDDLLRSAALERSQTEIELRNAIRTDELRLHYQPEIDLGTGEFLGAEALVRWQHPERGFLAAGSFIKVAEESGLSVDLGVWVTAEACRQAATWRAEHPELRFTMRVNLSPAQLTTRNIVQVVANALADSGLPGRFLCLEITEHAVLQDLDQAVATLHALKDLGVRLAIDDFGTGYSSMAQLKALPVDILKIDQSFVQGIGTDNGDRAIVAATLGLGAAFGLDVVAEGIETAEMVEELRVLGCRRGQGYLLRRPAAPADLAELIAAGRIDLDTIMAPPPPRPSRRSGSPSSRSSLRPNRPSQVPAVAGRPRP